MFGVQLMMITITKQYKERKHLKEINMSKTQKKMETSFEDLMWTEKIWIDEEMYMISGKIGSHIP